MEIIQIENRVLIKNERDNSTIELECPPGTFRITPASKAILNAIDKERDRVGGIGIDWGTGVGCPAIPASKIAGVERIFGLELLEENILAARKNALDNQCESKVCFMRSDSYLPFCEEERHSLESIRGKVSFILANPPSSDNDDGLGFRRRVLEEGKEFLKDEGLIFLNISFQYGEERIKKMVSEISGYKFLGKVYGSEVCDFDLSRDDLMKCILDLLRKRVGVILTILLFRRIIKKNI